MATIAIVGGHGKVARLLVPLLAGRGHTPVALTRNPEHAAQLDALGARWRAWDLEASDPDGDVDVLRGADVVVFAAGGGPDGRADRKWAVDRDGSVRSVRAAEALGIPRFVQVSAIGIDKEPEPAAGPVWTAYVQAKRDADEVLRASRLGWTILRPGTLTDDPGSGLVRLGDRLDDGRVPRADVAAVIAAVIDDDRTVGHQWELVSGTRRVAEEIDAAL